MFILRAFFISFLCITYTSALCAQNETPETQTVTKTDSQDEDAPFGSTAAAAQRLKHMTMHAHSFSGTRESTDGKTLGKIRAVNKPLLRRANRYSDIKDGILAGWVDESGRPMAMAQICLIPKSEEDWCIEMQSLSAESFELDAEFNGPWRPSSPGIEWKPLPSPKSQAMKPARTEVLRLAQMRKSARRFRCEDYFGSNDNNENALRLLTTPPLRYQDPDRGIVDGAMFVMVHDTDPELIILIELRESKKEEHGEYFYALAAMTSFELKVSLDGKQVWHKPKMESNLDTDVFWQRQLADSAGPPNRGFLQRLLGF